MTAAEQTPAIGLSEATRRITVLREQRAAWIARHEAELKRIDDAIAEATSHRDLVLAGATLDIVAVAESLIEVRGREHVREGEGPRAVADAIRDLAAGATKLRHTKIATKHYDRWHGQREDGTYGSAPRHGYELLSIGLTEPYRNRHVHDPEKRRMVPVDGLPISEAQTDAAIAYLHALLRTPAGAEAA